MSTRQPILSVKNLTTSFETEHGWLQAVQQVSFDLFPGETLGIVGESGCGKSVTSKSIMRLLPDYGAQIATESELLFEDKDLSKLTESEMRSVRGDRIAMIFQDPMTALNPVFTIGWQIDEALKYHTELDHQARQAKALEMLKLVEIPQPEQRLNEYPHQLSGGMRQRVMIAIALCCEPDILIADEPTTALDVTIQAQILNLMGQLQKELNTAIILVTHDLGVVAEVCDRVLVMYAGEVVESADIHSLFNHPRHPYTKALLNSLPGESFQAHRKKLPVIEGMVPSLHELPPGCRFQPRCLSAQEKCQQEHPVCEPHEGGSEVRCFFPLDTLTSSSN